MDDPLKPITMQGAENMIVVGLYVLFREKINAAYDKLEAEIAEWYRLTPAQNYDTTVFAQLTGQTLHNRDRVRCVKAIRHLVKKELVTPQGTMHDSQLRKHFCWVHLTEAGVKRAEELLGEAADE